ncbi:MAG: hypothetical protein JO351_07980, partial [Candidatus Eremiobacteraeota bacterium]|nr:hypothetical protein [Candidatus Eremiobacteraeota bacterium]
VSSPGSYNIYYWQPRYSITYTESPDTVWRFSGGRYAEPPLTAAVQYQNLSGNATALWANFLNAGFTSPFHPLPGETSAQYDLSYEHHVRGTDLSFKITPFYGLTSNWEQQSFIGAGFVTQIPVGKYENYGAEFALTKGDFSRNGFSGQLAFTYTHAYTQYQSGVVPNQINTLNTLILNYNCLTKAGYNQFKGQCNNLGYAAPSQCYEAGKGVSCNAPCLNAMGSTVSCSASTVAYSPVLNAYYNEPVQALQNPNGWYPGTIYQLQPSLGPAYAIYAQGYASPYVASLVASWRHDRLAITPSFQWQSGTYYGSPMDVVGTDPRVCNLSQGVTGVATSNNPLDCDYRHVSSVGNAAQFGYLYIPNPATGQFSNIGQFVEPNIAVGNMQVSYDPSPKIRLQATLTNIFHVCWGGTSQSWTSPYSPGNVYCGYNSNSLYVGKTPGQGWFNGASPNDKKANGVTPYVWQTQPYFPLTGNGVGSYFPFNAYFSATVKL